MLVMHNSQFTSEVVCPGLLMAGWSWGLLIGAVRRGVGLPRTTVVGVGEVMVVVESRVMVGEVDGGGR